MIRTNQPVSKYPAFSFLDQTSAKKIQPHPKISTVSTSDFLSSSDSAGALPLTTTNGFNYILVSVMENYTHPALMKSRTQDRSQR